MPIIDFSFNHYYKAYSMLRSSANQNGIIPLSEILSYTDHFIIIHTKEEFVDIIRELELEEARFKKEKEEQKKKPELRDSSKSRKKR